MPAIISNSEICRFGEDLNIACAWRAILHPRVECLWWSEIRALHECISEVRVEYLGHAKKTTRTGSPKRSVRRVVTTYMVMITIVTTKSRVFETAFSAWVVHLRMNHI